MLPINKLLSITVGIPVGLPAPGPLGYLPGTHTLARGRAATLTAARELLALSLVKGKAA